MGRMTRDTAGMAEHVWQAVHMVECARMHGCCAVGLL
jgi:hypothetical protein